MSRALFLDRDGTLIYDRHYLSDPKQVELIPGVKEALHKALDWGFMLFIHTNQSGVARGLYTEEQIAACNQRLLELLELPAPGFTDICIATEGPSDPLIYRKPSPKFINEKLAEHHFDPFMCWMIGDRLSDLQCATNAGIWPIYLQSGKPLDPETEQYIREEEIHTYPSLLEFVDSIHEKQSEHPGL